MTIVHHLLSPTEAQRLTQRIKLTASTIRDNLWKLRNLVEEAKTSNAWQVLGFASWTAYLADTLADEPMRLGRDERQELVEYLSGEGLSTRAIAPIVGVTHETVAQDIKTAPVRNLTPAPVESSPEADSPEFDPTPTLPPREDDWVPADPLTGEVIEPDPVTVTEHTITEKVKTVTGLDGKTYTTLAPTAPRRKALTDTARDLGWDFRKVAERLQRLREDDRFSRNEEEVAALLKGHLMFTVEVCQDLLDEINN